MSYCRATTPCFSDEPRCDIAMSEEKTVRHFQKLEEKILSLAESIAELKQQHATLLKSLEPLRNTAEKVDLLADRLDLSEKKE